MEGTDILKQIENCEKTITLLEEELLSFETSYRKIQSKRLKNKMVKIKNEIDKEITRQAELKIRGYEMIRALSEESEKWVLIYRFICLFPTERIAARLNYSERHVQRLCKSGCEKINAQYRRSLHNI